MLELRKQEAPQRLYGHESYLVNCHKPAGSARSDFENLNFRLPASAIMPCKPSPIIVLSHLRHVRLFATPWTIAHQAPLSMGLSREEYWSGLPCPSPGPQYLASAISYFPRVKRIGLQGTSLGVQWIRIHLPGQATEV